MTADCLLWSVHRRRPTASDRPAPVSCDNPSDAVELRSAIRDACPPRPSSRAAPVERREIRVSRLFEHVRCASGRSPGGGMSPRGFSAGGTDGAPDQAAGPDHPTPPGPNAGQRRSHNPCDPAHGPPGARLVLRGPPGASAGEMDGSVTDRRPEGFHPVSEIRAQNVRPPSDSSRVPNAWTDCAISTSPRPCSLA